MPSCLTLMQRRRRGLTSPPLVGVENNPGPKGKARRQSRPSNPKSSPTSSHLTAEQKTAIQVELSTCTNFSAIARKLNIKRRAVARWANRLDESGEMKERSRAKKTNSAASNDTGVDDDQDIEVSEPQRKKYKEYKQCSQFEKGKIVAWSEDDHSVRSISQRTGRSIPTVCRWKDRGVTGDVERKPGSRRPRCSSATDTRAWKRRVLGSDSGRKNYRSLWESYCQQMDHLSASPRGRSDHWAPH